MSAQSILYLFLFFFAIQLIVELGLIALNIQHVKNNSGKIPDLFADTFDKDTYNRSIEYTLERAKLSIASTIVSAATLLIFVLSGSFGQLNEVVTGFQLPWYWTGILFVFLTSLYFH